MLVGVFSDVHDNLDNLRKVLSTFNEKGVETAIFCGDFCSPIPSRVMGEGFKGDIHCVFGNGDGDPFTISKFANSEFPNLKLHGLHIELEFEGRKLCVTHYPFYAKALARTGDYDAVFFGHNHTQSEELIGKCLLFNPGEVLGWKGNGTFAIYNTGDNTAEVFTL